jgi:hypothetical protein
MPDTALPLYGMVGTRAPELVDDSTHGVHQHVGWKPGAVGVPASCRKTLMVAADPGVSGASTSIYCIQIAIIHATAHLVGMVGHV